MHDSPSSPRRSIAPAPLKQQQAKKAGAPKAKGAVRAKSGCYTCRIRRKKCDERPNAEGRCETCIRLRLQCLGFGQKRPEWLKENNNVSMFREKIKDFLAAQGMIKGHSGSGARTAEQEGMLVLITDHGRSDTSSPHSPTLSVDSSEDRRPNGHNISSLRHDPHYPSISLPPQHSHSGYSTQPQPSTGAPPLPVPSQAPISMPISGLAPTHPLPFTSTLPPSYQQQYVLEEEEYNDAELSHHSYYIEHSLNDSIAPFITTHQSGLVRHYLDHVLQRQYLLADTSIADFIIRTVQRNPAVRDAVCLLATLHQETLRQAKPSTAPANALVLHEPSSDPRRTYKRICDNLRSSAAEGYTEGEAMAGLFVVSAFLFKGGRGAWQQFLAVAAEWVWTVFNQTAADPAETIMRCTDSQQFVIKTTFWFDILASTTRLEPPRFLNIYRRLWSPRRAAYIDDAHQHPHQHPHPNPHPHPHQHQHQHQHQHLHQQHPPAQPPLSMMSVMGCENETALAIAEISALACWKEAQERHRTLSVPDLVDRGRTIEAECLPRTAAPQPQSQSQPQPQPAPAPAPAGNVFYPAGGVDDLAAKRRLTADIFRATARVYLHTVISGEHPGCPEIREGVRETIECLRRVPAVGGVGGPGSGSGASASSSSSSSVARSVLRSVVFGLCLCGCLADDPEEREFLLRRLDAEEQAEDVGNCASARLVMQEVWKRRPSGGGETPLSWREATQQFGGESLLLV
ncbi:fungal-specific transcription factor domain-containing protein [Russula earlei]|uniref:Fungal-specific transcription factor domain-containing protein n=1 Tax=Russula earlei TaxID=71964 RepID=A0ACC0U3B5_9AGAM|nr:fungal-specific transcription factor domain-containing protein [Russula earlei]